MQTLFEILLPVASILFIKFAILVVIEISMIMGLAFYLDRRDKKKYEEVQLSGVVIKFYADTKDWSCPDYYRGWEGPGWYFWDETDTTCYGPYETEKGAREDAKQYFEDLNKNTI